MAQSPSPYPTIKASLTRFIVAATIFAGLAITCLLTADHDLRVLAGILATFALLITLLFGTDTGKAINRESLPNRALRVLGAILIFPLAIAGAIFIAAGLVGVFVSIRSIEMDVCAQSFSAETLEATMRLAVCFLMPLAGYSLLRKGLRQDPAITKVVHRGPRAISSVSVPLWFRILMLTQGIAVGTLALAFAVAAIATTCEAAAWIWRPTVCSAIVAASAALGARILVLRRHRAVQKVK